MKKLIAPLSICVALALTTQAQIGRRFPSEKKIVKDPVTGTMLTFLTSTPAGDAKIYQTHPQWTSDGQWLVFRSGRARNEALAVNEKTGDIVQVTEGGYTGMLNLARKSMKLYLMRNPNPGARGGDLQIVEVDLARVFADSKAGKMQPAATYQRVCGIVPANLRAGGDMALDANEDVFSSLDKVDDAIQNHSFPHPPARIELLVSKNKPSDPLVIAFLNWILTDGQKYCDAAGYVSLSADIQKQQVALVK